MQNHLPSLDTMARLVAPTLGGLLLGGLFVPPAALGSILGAAAGFMIGLARGAGGAGLRQVATPVHEAAAPQTDSAAPALSRSPG